MFNLSFLVRDKGNAEALVRTLASVNECACLNKEILVWKKGAGNQERKLDGQSLWCELDNCLACASGDIVWLLEEGDEVDWTQWQGQINRLVGDSSAICLLPYLSDLLPANEKHFGGAHFLFLCLVSLYAPGYSGGLGLIFKNRQKPLSVDSQLKELGIADLCFQLARHGRVLFAQYQALPLENSELIDDWLVFAAKHSSLLTCLGSAQEYLHQLLALQFLELSELQEMSRTAVIEVDELMALREKFFFKLNCSPSKAGILWRAVCSVISQSGALLEQKLSNAGQYLVASREVKEHEDKLRSLLMSRSWKSTKWLRDLRRTMVLQPIIAVEGEPVVSDGNLSGAAYLQFLKTQIDSIYSSKSWLLTRPLRAWESLGGE